MYSFLCKNNRLLVISTRVRVSICSKTQFRVFRPCEKSKLVRLFSSSILEDKQSFTVSYLVSSCGFPLEDAKSVSMKVQFRDPKNTDSVLVLLRNYGYSNNHITRIIEKFPRVLLSNPEKTLKPKLVFLNSIGISGNDLVKFVCKNPGILNRSLKNLLIPLYNFLKDITSSDEKAVKLYLWMGIRYSLRAVQNKCSPNVAVLKQLGVPESCIYRALRSMTMIMFRDCHVFEKLVNRVHNVGYDPKKTIFIDALRLFSCFGKSNLECKKEVYKRWGWSENDLNFAWKNYPIVFTISEKNITNTLYFLVNQMGYKSVDIARYPIVLTFNLEMRIVPRCLVHKALLLKGQLVKQLSLGTLLRYTDNQFMEKFVARYEKEVPQLLKIYERKISLSDLGFSSEDIKGVKLL